MEDAIVGYFLAAILGPMLVVLGLSVLCYRKAWAKIVADFKKNHYTMIPLAIVSLLLGLFVVNVYNVWEWDVFLIITLLGWIMILKSAFYFLAPSNWIKAWMNLANPKYLWLGGLIDTVLGLVLCYYAFL